MMDEEKIQKIMGLARELASCRTDEGLDKAAKILLHAIKQGYENPESLVTAANYLLQGSQMSKIETKKEAISLVDKAISLGTHNITILESAIHCYELILNDFPEKINNIIQLCLKVIESNPEHIDCMVTLATHRDHPSVALSLDEAIKMLEWAREIEPANSYVAFTLVRLYSEAGEYRKARRLYKQGVFHLKPNSIQATPHDYQEKSWHPKIKRKKYRKYGKN